MTKSKIVAALAAITLAGGLSLASAPAQAHHYHGHHGLGIGLGFAAGTLIGAAVASNAYAYPPAYYGDCYKVVRYDRWGYRHRVTVCRPY
jgi:hypothetical protein